MVSKCSYDMLNRVCLLRSQGFSRRDISKKLGIDRKTIYNWIKKGEKARIGKYAKFYSDWQKATEDYYKLNPPKNKSCGVGIVFKLPKLPDLDVCPLIMKKIIEKIIDFL